MVAKYARLFAGIVGILSLSAGSVQAQKKEAPVEKKGASFEVSDRITPIVRVVKKCQGAVVAFVNNEGKAKGTGVIVDGRGLIVTNVHVLGGEKTVKVHLIDKTEHIGTVVFLAGAYDLALVKINSSQKLDVVPPSTSDNVFIGEDVIAIGHPYGYSYSISRGILSATGRKIRIPTGDTIEEVYQTDTAINPGNSGGPLMNIHGELIAINFAMRDQAQNIAFAIPAKKVREVLAKYPK